MTAALYRLETGRLLEARPGDELVLDGAEGHHAATVKRARVGEQLLVADGGPRVAVCVVRAVGGATAGSLALEIVEFSSHEHAGPRFVLVQALAKNDRDLQALEAATELGVDEIVPWQAERSIVQWKGERGQRAHRKWVSLAESAAKQSRRPSPPEVAELVNLKDLAARVAGAEAAFVLHEEAEQPLATAELPATGEVLLVVGPEGGIGPREIGELSAAGGLPVRLGRYVLRSSSAGPAAIAVLSAAGRWRTT